MSVVGRTTPLVKKCLTFGRRRKALQKNPLVKHSKRGELDNTPLLSIGKDEQHHSTDSDPQADRRPYLPKAFPLDETPVLVPVRSIVNHHKSHTSEEVGREAGGIPCGKAPKQDRITFTSKRRLVYLYSHSSLPIILIMKRLALCSSSTLPST